jgi:Zn finger protein HypA/HybF involved in hydrogenase expression
MELTLTDFVLLVLAGAGSTVLLLTMASRLFHARSEAQSLMTRVVCRLCLHAFEDRTHRDIVNCPHCGAANEKGRGRRLG